MMELFHYFPCLIHEVNLSLVLLLRTGYTAHRPLCHGRISTRYSIFLQWLVCNASISFIDFNYLLALTANYIRFW